MIQNLVETNDHQFNFWFFCCMTSTFRFISFANEKTKTVKNFKNLISYILYLPLLCGPWCLYSNFDDKKIQKKFLPAKFIRYIILILLIEWYLHLIPISAAKFDHKVLEELSLPGLGGLVILAVSHFSLKYKVFYGIPATWAEFDGINCPGEPHFIMTRKFLRI